VLVRLGRDDSGAAKARGPCKRNSADRKQQGWHYSLAWLVFGGSDHTKYCVQVHARTKDCHIATASGEASTMTNLASIFSTAEIAASGLDIGDQKST
jgi:hypothetical protein